MWLDDINVVWNDFELTEKEITVMKIYCERYSYFLNFEFNNTIAETEIKMNKYHDKDFNHLLFKTIVIMQKKWANSIADFNKVFWSTETSNYGINIEEQNIKINELQEKISIQTMKDSDEALLLSEKIKNWD